MTSQVTSDQWLPVLLLFSVTGAIGINNITIIAPEKIRVGESVILTCNYNLDKNVQLYAIKWHLDGEEFFKYIPKNKIPYITYPVRNISVNVKNSNEYDLELMNMQKSNSGWYKCEVTEEHPNYGTQIKEVEIIVVDVPRIDPIITVEKQHLSLGEKARANCTLGASDPAPNITWLLNGRPLKNNTKQFKSFNKIVSEEGKFFHYLSILDTNNVFKNHHFELKCFAEIGSVYRKGSAIVLTEDIPHIAQITGDASPQSRQSSGCGYIMSIDIFWLESFMIRKMCLILGLLLVKKFTS